MKTDETDSDHRVIPSLPDFESEMENLKNMGADFITILANREESGISLTYYFRLKDRLITLQIHREEKAITSLYSLFGTADFIEREINHLFGIKFIGNPNLERI